jgi:hypothetical protein
MTRLPCPYDWDDLVLPPDVVTQLRAFETQVRLRWTVSGRCTSRCLCHQITCWRRT